MCTVLQPWMGRFLMAFILLSLFIAGLTGQIGPWRHQTQQHCRAEGFSQNQHLSPATGAVAFVPQYPNALTHTNTPREPWLSNERINIRQFWMSAAPVHVKACTFSVGLFHTCIHTHICIHIYIKVQLSVPAAVMLLRCEELHQRDADGRQ